ncbi:Hsp70 family protein [Candidatus Viadribacter manganicus]|uniref:Molecular chaperone Hsp70 n=1 Tax=Candidatus Viadribacter manganicus TaxID=1759059 RepID=A0A1B1AEI8_9PROT|nr:Hsp70 family protein [Candidatus Viadribacter manganicus]ANP44968.1 molecular chaperone Hsp70 [Candidatus Viadribacter manganicus]
MTQSIGLDFGTTNTVATMINAEDAAEAMHFAHAGEAFDAFRSVLCFWQTQDETSNRTNVEAGPWAVDQFLELAGDCRFIQSFKTFAASPLFSDTLIFNRRLKFEDLLASFLRQVRAHAGAEFPKRIVIGRPVKFAGAAPDEALARARYEAALRAVGFEEIHHVYEPVAAAYFFAQRLNSEATILVADFGGGTSDFSVVRFSRGPNGLDYKPLSHTGVGIAGDAFDYRIIDNVVARAFGKGSEYKSWDKILPVPNGYFTKFSRWNELSIMRHSRDYRDLQQLVRSSLDPDRIRAFIAFLDADAGYAMNRAVSAAKMQLSSADEGTLSLHVAGVDIERKIKRSEFEKWIAPELEDIGATVDRALAEAGITETGIDRVFLTGGSSFVPAVRAQFESRFGAAKIETGDQLVSIAYGLALIAGDGDVSRWTT